MKSMKRIFAVVLAVMMVALMIPVTASAATNTSLTLTCDKAEFTFDVYQLATIDENGKMEVLAQDQTVKAAVETAGSDAATAALITACNAASANGLGTKLASFDGADGTKTYSNANGVYFIKPVAKGAATKANSSIAVVTTEDVTVSLASKVATDSANVTKEISKVNGTATTTDKEKAVATAGLDDVIEYTLTAKVPNSTANKITAFNIVDKIESGLTPDKNSIVVTVEGTATALVKGTDYTVVDTQDGFKVALTCNADGILPKYLGKVVTVKFNATVNANATSGTDSNDNEDSIEYKFDGDTDFRTMPGEKVQVFTFLITLTKTDSADSTKFLPGAEFDLKDASGATIIDAESDNKGVVDFGVQLNAGTYSVVETKAPVGYVLNSNPVNIVINPTITGTKGDYKLTNLANGTTSTGVVGMTITNSKVTVPETGGMGTTMFTIGGATLIALAGVMFIILKRKKTSK